VCRICIWGINKENLTTSQTTRIYTSRLSMCSSLSTQKARLPRHRTTSREEVSKGGTLYQTSGQERKSRGGSVMNDRVETKGGESKTKVETQAGWKRECPHTTKAVEYGTISLVCVSSCHCMAGPRGAVFHQRCDHRRLEAWPGVPQKAHSHTRTIHNQAAQPRWFVLL